MSRAFEQFVADGQSLAEGRGLTWNVSYDHASGRISKDEWWDLSAAAGRVERPRKIISSFAAPPPSHVAVQTVLKRSVPHVMAASWVAFFKSIAMHDLFVNGRTPGNFTSNVSESLRILAICAGDTPPPLLTADIVSAAYNAALIATPSGKRASTLKALIATWLDGTGIASHRPLAQYCEPNAQIAKALEGEARLVTTRRRQADSKRPNALRSELSQQHFAEKLPDEEALAELLRIVFSAAPETFTDLVRFHQARLLIASGLRLGELVSLPQDCLVVQEPEPTRAGVFGPQVPLVMLKHYAEKQGAAGRGVEWVNAVQHVPSLLVPTVAGSISAVLDATAPLRNMVEAQRRTGSLFPDLEQDALIPWTDAYTRLSGMMRVSKEEIPGRLRSEYRKKYDLAALARIRLHQRKAIEFAGVTNRVRDYFWGIQADICSNGLLRDALGSGVPLVKNERFGQRTLYVRVGEMEDYARTHLPTKVPDMRLSQSTLGAIGMEHKLFLYPGRALAEAKHDSIVDIERYFSVQSASPKDLELQLGGKAKGGRLFQRYGESPKAIDYGINPHSLRHLQNTELFRLGIADTIITKRFNRRTTAQSYVYDHRSLSDHLEEMEPEKARMADKALSPNARKAFDLMRGGKIRGPVVSAFERLQAEQGDESAFEYLNAEAGALHFTPYGFCLNSFAASPCVKHLECFNKCSHLVRSDSPDEQKTLETLKTRYEVYVRRLHDRPSRAPNFQAQLGHAEERLAGLKAALSQAPGQSVFPGGESLHSSSKG
ncbi:hypothetical protein [Caulobacter sp. NIBR2454]|uniref:hypothetical protein n=1 Tax=Caulobacter sp. NIBR2454 TaxID=3015996 RepID=UPI0022B6C951|nr:hypothetical protein [Caulobacter sp. NIBR2454]